MFFRQQSRIAAFFLKTAFQENFFRVCCIYACLNFFQSKLEVKKEAGESPPSEAACLCSPPPAKNQCASCGMEIQDRYLLKVRNLTDKTNKILPFCFSLFSYVFLTLRRISLYWFLLFSCRLITWTGTWVVWNVQSAERLYANTTAATSKTKKSSANWIILGKMKVSLRRASCKQLSGNKSDTINILERPFLSFSHASIYVIIYLFLKCILSRNQFITSSLTSVCLVVFKMEFEFGFFLNCRALNSSQNIQLSFSYLHIILIIQIILKYKILKTCKN